MGEFINSHNLFLVGQNKLKDTLWHPILFFGNEALSILLSYKDKFDAEYGCKKSMKSNSWLKKLISDGLTDIYRTNL